MVPFNPFCWSTNAQTINTPRVIVPPRSWWPVGPHLGHQLLEVNLADLRPTAIRYTNLPRSHFLGPYYQVGAISLQKEPVSGYASDTLDLLLYKKNPEQPADPKEHYPTSSYPLVHLGRTPSERV